MLYFVLKVKVIDEENNILPVNTPGELCYRGHCVFQGYWQDEKKTSEAIDENGWFHTGFVDFIVHLFFHLSLMLLKFSYGTNEKNFYVSLISRVLVSNFYVD